MRIRIVQKPHVPSVDGLDLSKFLVGRQYDVGSAVSALFLAEGWAEPADRFEPVAAAASPKNDPPRPSNLTREFFPPYYQGPNAPPADERRKASGRRDSKPKP